jgi:NAD(P)H-dependent flavin oxidoreductase YrpB (nitropropane dioxygenase family)
MLVKESPVHENFKRLCLEATEQDTLYDNVFDGMDGRVLKTKASVAMTKRGFPIMEAFKAAIRLKNLLNLSYPKFISSAITMATAEEGHPLWVLARQAVGITKHLKAIHEGDTEEGILFAGQCVGGITDVPTTKELIDQMIAEAEQTITKLPNFKVSA